MPTRLLQRTSAGPEKAQKQWLESAAAFSLCAVSVAGSGSDMSGLPEITWPSGSRDGRPGALGPLWKPAADTVLPTERSRPGWPYLAGGRDRETPR